MAADTFSKNLAMEAYESVGPFLMGDPRPPTEERDEDEAMPPPPDEEEEEEEEDIPSDVVAPAAVPTAGTKPTRTSSVESKESQISTLVLPAPAPPLPLEEEEVDVVAGAEADASLFEPLTPPSPAPICEEERRRRIAATSADISASQYAFERARFRFVFPPSAMMSVPSPVAP